MQHHWPNGQSNGVASAWANELVKPRNLKKFSGKPEDFDEFERSWENHLRMVSATNGGEPVNSFACLQILRTALDPASIAMLDAKLAQDPELEYYEFWKEFTARHRRHSQAIQKKNWEAVKVT